MKPRHKRYVFCIVSVLLAVLLAGLLAEGLCRLFGLGSWIVYERHLYRPAAFPGLSYELTPGAHAYAYGHRIRINSYGCRGEEISPIPEPGVFRIVAVGDSMTFGMGVGDTEHWPYVLGDLIEPPPGYDVVETINAGVCGYNFRQNYVAITRKVLQLRPHLIVLGLVSNDLAPCYTATPDGYLIFPMIRGSLPIPGKRWLQTHSHFYQFSVFQYHQLRYALGTHRRDSAAEVAASPASPWLRMQPLFEDLVASLDVASVRLLCVKLSALDDPALDHMLTRHHIPCVRADFSAHGDTIPDGHPSAQGHLKIAAQVARAAARTLSTSRTLPQPMPVPSPRLSEQLRTSPDRGGDVSEPPAEQPDAH